MPDVLITNLGAISGSSTLTSVRSFANALTETSNSLVPNFATYYLNYTYVLYVYAKDMLYTGNISKFKQGTLSPEAFNTYLRSYFPKLSEQTIKDCWNAMSSAINIPFLNAINAFLTKENDNRVDVICITNPWHFEHINALITLHNPQIISDKIRFHTHFEGLIKYLRFTYKIE